MKNQLLTFVNAHLNQEKSMLFSIQQEHVRVLGGMLCRSTAGRSVLGFKLYFEQLKTELLQEKLSLIHSTSAPAVLFLNFF